MNDDPPKIPPLLMGPSLLSGCLTVVMGLAGTILLLPGLCAVIVGIQTIGRDTTRDEYNTVAFVIIGLVLGFVGVMLLWGASRRRKI